MAQFNVKNFGAKGNGTDDDTLAIRSAIRKVIADSGGEVFFPAGVYKTTGLLKIGSGRVCLRGEGHASVIRAIGNFNTVDFSGAKNDHIYGNKIMDLLFDEAGKTGGKTIVGNYVAQFYAIRIFGANGWNGFQFHNFNNVTVEDCRFESYRGEFYGKATGGSLGGDDNDRSDVMRLYNLVFGGTRKIGMIGFEIDGFVHTVNGWSVHFVGIGAQALLVRNTIRAKQDPTFLTFDDFECDYAEQEAIRIEEGLRMFFNNSQIHGTKGETSNIFIGKNTRCISFTGGFSTGANQCGIAIAGKDVTVSAMHFSENNNRTSNKVYPGILLGGTSKGVIITGCRSGGPEGSAVVQSSGCQVDTGADDFVIVGNNFRFNDKKEVNNGAGTGPSKLIANNIF